MLYCAADAGVGLE